MKITFILALLVAGAYAQGAGDETSINGPFCGQRESLFVDNGKIVGGQIAKPGDWKWMTILKYNGNFFCGSSLINSRWLLTAAHCTSGK